MNHIQLYNKCAEIGELPKVHVKTPVRHSEKTIGQIVGIAETGISVRFPDMKWDTWYWNSDAEDKRKHYMYELSLVH